MKREDCFKEYFTSVFKNSNVFSDKEYQEHSIFYKSNYQRFLPLSKSAAIIDIACGAGHFLYYLSKAGYSNYCGIDISREQVEFCRNNISDKVIEADVFSFLADKENAYDAITANDFLEHINKDTVVDFLSLAYRALRPGGRIILKTPNMGNPFALRLRYTDFTHEIGFAEKSLYQVFWLAGFRDIDLYPSVRKLRTRIIQFFLKKLFVYQDFVSPEILTSLLIGVGKK